MLSKAYLPIYNAMNKAIFLVAALTFVAAGFGQVSSSKGIERSVSDQANAFGPDIHVPDSNIRRPGDAVSKRYTSYLHYKGVWRHSSVDDQPSPLLAMASGARLGLQPTINGYHPADIRPAYGLPADGGQGAIAIVDAMDDPSILADFNVFCSTMGLPTENSSSATAATNTVFQVVYAAGTKPPYDMGWAGEISLDVEWAHAVAPGAKIYLVEASSSSNQALDQAVQVAESLPNVKEVSMSFGSSGEYSGEQAEDAVYTQPGVVYFSATGDSAANRGYPSMSLNVMAVGGTSITLASGHVINESVWNMGGCGPSSYVSRPGYQNVVASIVGNVRGTPDISADADPNTGVAVYNSNDIGQSYNSGGWEIDGGTSLACPLCAAIANVRGNFSSTSVTEHTRVYSELGSSFMRDIVNGAIVDRTVSPSKTYNAAPGYDLASGLGEPVGFDTPNTILSLIPQSVHVVSGIAIDGAIANLYAFDGATFDMVSRLSPGQGQAAEFSVTTNALPAPIGDHLTALQVNVSAIGLIGVTEQIQALNVNTNAYDTLSVVTLQRDPVSSMVALDLTKYVAANGSVQVRVAADRPLASGSSTFTYRVDRVNFTATYAP
jgi:hypothetical protein